MVLKGLRERLLINKIVKGKIRLEKANSYLHNYNAPEEKLFFDKLGDSFLEKALKGELLSTGDMVMRTRYLRRALSSYEKSGNKEKMLSLVDKTLELNKKYADVNFHFGSEWEVLMEAYEKAGRGIQDILYKMVDHSLKRDLECMFGGAIDDILEKVENGREKVIELGDELLKMKGKYYKGYGLWDLAGNPNHTDWAKIAYEKAGVLTEKQRKINEFHKRHPHKDMVGPDYSGYSSCAD